MRPIPFLVSTAFLLASETAADFPGNFSRSCTGVGLSHNFFLGASCSHPDNNGVNSQSVNQFDLAMCIGLDQASGKMQWEVYGKFSNYCSNCTISADEGEHLLTCACQPLVSSHGPVLSTINLDEGITNEWGTLKCAGGVISRAVDDHKKH
ncbi:CVNH domain-containing protein [Chaetomium sp. MPI-SDFR-AT-0129]|nr:CVNH domain-containing protein [Chaetomium sp. MPI-SDFR-AT-0129]